MYRLSLLCLFFISLTFPSFADLEIVTLPQEIISQGNGYTNYAYYRKKGENGIFIPAQYNNDQRFYMNELNTLENYALNHSFSNENNYSRLCRLEMLAFGAIQNGDFNTRYENVRSAILSRPKVSQNNSTWRNIVNYFVGQTTGYTPPIWNSASDYPYSRSTVNLSGPYSQNRRFYNQRAGNRSSITILD